MQLQLLFLFFLNRVVKLFKKKETNSYSFLFIILIQTPIKCPVNLFIQISQKKHDGLEICRECMLKLKWKHTREIFYLKKINKIDKEEVNS